MKRISYSTRNIIIGILVLLFIIVDLLYLSHASAVGMNPYIVIFFTLILLLLATVFMKRITNFDKGQEGERKVDKLLANLPNGYYPLHDVTLGKKGNIDEVIISTKGIWTIEVKNIKSGQITFKNELLHLNKHPMAGISLKQAYAEAHELQDYIRTTLQIFTPVQPVLLFANPYNTMKFGFENINGVQVIGINWLAKLVLHHSLSNGLTTEQCITIKDELKKLTSII